MTEVKKIKKLISDDASFLEETYHVKKMGIFGLTARGDSKKSSDIDILVEFKEPIGFFDFLELERHPSKLLKKKVDLVTPQAVKPAIKKDVLRETIYV